MTSAAQWISRGASLGLYPPPGDASRYAKKPLPPLPPRRESSIAAPSAEVREAFIAPPKTATAGAGDGPFVFDWEESPGRAVRLSQSAGPNDMVTVRQRQQSLPASDVRTRIVTPTSASQKAGPRSAGLQRSIARAPAGPHLRPDPPQRHMLLSAPINNHVTPTASSAEILSPQPRSSVQKILKLTGNMSPTTTLSIDIPSLHNSTRKISQLTGLDPGSGKGSDEVTLQTLDEEDSITPRERTSSWYSYNTGDDMSYAQPESLFSNSYADSVHPLNTPLSAPRYAPNTSPPSRQLYAPGNSYQCEDGFPSPVTTPLRLGGFIAADVGVTTPGDVTPIHGKRESRCQHHSGNGEGTSSEMHSSSSSEISASEFELEPTAAKLYHDMAVDMSKISPSFPPSFPPSVSPSAGGGGGGPSKLQSKFGWDKKLSAGDTTTTPFPIPPSRGNRHGSIGALTIDSTHSFSPSLSRFSLKTLRNKGKDSLDASASPSSSSSPSFFTRGASASKHAHPHTSATPSPPVSSSIRASVEEAAAASGDGQVRLSLLARIFTSGSTGGSGASSVRDSTRSAGSSSNYYAAGQHQRTASVASSLGGGGMMVVTTPEGAAAATVSSWSPDTPSPGETATFGEASRRGSGLLARTMEQARHAAGRKGKERERAEREKVEEEKERARASLRGRIKVMREEGGE